MQRKLTYRSGGKRVINKEKENNIYSMCILDQWFPSINIIERVEESTQTAFMMFSLDIFPRGEIRKQDE